MHRYLIPKARLSPRLNWQILPLLTLCLDGCRPSNVTLLVGHIVSRCLTQFLDKNPTRKTKIKLLYLDLPNNCC